MIPPTSAAHRRTSPRQTQARAEDSYARPSSARAVPRRITRSDVDLAGGPDDHVLTFFQMTVRYWQAKRTGDPRAWLYRETLVRRFLKRQGEARP